MKEKEILSIFNDRYERIGRADREEIHSKGFWHETFHCWIAFRDQGRDMVYFQLRSMGKRDFPGLLDITAAGHLLDHEAVSDGIREVYEELGLALTFEDLHPLGALKEELIDGPLIDREWSNVFLLEQHIPFEAFHLQEEEVAGIFAAGLDDVESLIKGGKDSIPVDGFRIQKGKKEYISSKVAWEAFVPHESTYMLQVIDRIRDRLRE
ncbi:NUDIX hydrolase [Rossellomorea marisflavi]|uniref:NUDIX hydrolase n=1 Tax=Rossellomorea marisflavi TaxID=189381 RepID=UPI00345763AC